MEIFILSATQILREIKFRRHSVEIFILSATHILCEINLAKSSRERKALHTVWKLQNFLREIKVGESENLLFERI